MNPIVEQARAHIAAMPEAISGEGGHTATFKAACALVRGFAMDEETAFELLEEWNDSHCHPSWEEHQIRHKIRDAMAARLPLGHLLDAPPLDELDESPLPRVPTWPPVDYAAINAQLAHPSNPQMCSLESLREASPMETGSLTAESVLPLLFPGNPLITAGTSSGSCKTTLLSHVLPKADAMQFIVPSAATKCKGLTLEGKPSQHCLSIVGTRQYLVLETDFVGDKGPCGRMLRCARFLEDMEPLDVSACLIGHMASILPTLALVAFSGSKSLHAWLNVSALADDEPTLKQFMRMAVSLGFDRAGWSKSQLCRIPGGTRRNKGTGSECGQPIYYFNPEQCLLP